MDCSDERSVCSTRCQSIVSLFGELTESSSNSSAASKVRWESNFLKTGGLTSFTPQMVAKSHWQAMNQSLKSSELTLIAINFLRHLSKIPAFEDCWYDPSWRAVPVQLLKMWSLYSIDCSDMAVDLSSTLVLLKRIQTDRPGSWESRELYLPKHFHVQVLWYLCYLVHSSHQDQAIKLSKWYKHLNGSYYFPGGFQQMIKFLFCIFEKMCNWKLNISEKRVRRLMQKLCSIPQDLTGA
eukprot:Platyproteum_vivax@DN8367_c0_g1_i1.p1